MGQWDYRARIIPLLSSMKPGPCSSPRLSDPDPKGSEDPARTASAFTTQYGDYSTVLYNPYQTSSQISIDKQNVCLLYFMLAAHCTMHAIQYCMIMNEA
jgi:hypothetical protein